MSKRKNETFAQLVVGTFMIAVVALLGYFTIVVSGVDVLAGRSKTHMTIMFDQVGGLKEHDNVMYRGTKVGTVVRVDVTPSNLLVRADVDANVILRRSCRIAVCNLSVLGGNYLMLEEGAGETMDLAKDVFRGETPTDWMQDVKRIASTMNDLVNRPEMQEIVSNVTAVSARARQIADKADGILTRINNGEGLVGKLMSADNKLYRDLEESVANMSEITDRVRRGEGLVGHILSKDDRLYSDLESTVSNVNEVVARVSQGEGFAGRLLSRDDRLYEDLRESVAAFRATCESLNLGDAKGDMKTLVANGSRLMENLNAVAERLKSGEGTLGKLANEPGMYNEVEGLIKDCRQIIDNYRDTTPIATFSSLLTGAL